MKHGTSDHYHDFYRELKEITSTFSFFFISTCSSAFESLKNWDKASLNMGKNKVAAFMLYKLMYERIFSDPVFSSLTVMVE